MKRTCYGIAAAITLISIGSSIATAQYGVTYNFGRSSAHPSGTLRVDSEGRLFGSANEDAGTNARSVAVELKSAQHGGWTELSTPNGPGGNNWVPDGKGNFYSSISGGGSKSQGAIVESSPSVGGGWTQKTIYSFGSHAADGQFPSDNPVFDVQGNLYGTTGGGGTHACGTVFELTQAANGKWTEKIVYNFGASASDAITPEGLIIDSEGNLFGTSYAGGAPSNDYFIGRVYGGTVFELTRQVSGEWQERVIHSFVPATMNDAGYRVPTGDGWTPTPGLLLDKEGDLYGATYQGLTWGCCDGPSDTLSEGTVFKLTPATHDQWKEQVLFLSCDNQVYCYSNSNLTMDPVGNLYGITAGGGSNLGVADGSGDTVFQVTPRFEQIVLHDFPTTQTDGLPSGGLTLSNGDLFGVTSNGGPEDYGTLYEIQSVANKTPVETTTHLEVSPSGSLRPGEPITITATVTTVTGVSIPTGTVTFEDAAGRGIARLLVAGKAQYTGLIALGGTYSLRAVYSAGPNFAPSKSAFLSETVK